MTPAEYIDRLKVCRIAVVHGGVPIAGETVVHETKEVGRGKPYDLVARDIAGGLIELGFYHVDLLTDDGLLETRLKAGRYGLVWLNAAGTQGKDGIAHGAVACEKLGLPYVGHSPGAAMLLDNKALTKAALIQEGIPTARFKRFDIGALIDLSILRAHFKATDADGPFIVKPESGRASIGVSKISRLDEVEDAVRKVWRSHEKAALVEEFVGGREFVVAVAGGSFVARNREIIKPHGPHPKAFAFSALERNLYGLDIATSMDAKSITPDSYSPVFGETRVRLLELARQVQERLGLESLVRLDVREDEHGVLHVLEINPKPDLTRPRGNSAASYVCGGLEQEGMDYLDLLLMNVANTLDHFQNKRPNVFQSLVSIIEGDAA
jgi:D-alanine-D-alanine ligase